MNGVPIVVLDEQSILMLPMNHSLIPMRNDLESNKSKVFFIQNSRIQVGRILFLDKNAVGDSVIIKSYLTTINSVDDSA